MYSTLDIGYWTWYFYIHIHDWTPQLLAEVSIKQCAADYAFPKEEDIMSKKTLPRTLPLYVCTYIAHTTALSTPSTTQHTPLHLARPALHTTHHYTPQPSTTHHTPLHSATQHYTYIQHTAQLLYVHALKLELFCSSHANYLWLCEIQKAYFNSTDYTDY